MTQFKSLEMSITETFNEIHARFYDITITYLNLGEKV